MSDPYTPFNRDALLAMTALLQQLAMRVYTTACQMGRSNS